VSEPQPPNAVGTYARGIGICLSKVPHAGAYTHLKASYILTLKELYSTVHAVSHALQACWCCSWYLELAAGAITHVKAAAALATG